MISNQDNYLFIKQMLVIIQAQRNGAEMESNGALLEPESVISMALNKLVDIEDNFTIPQFIENVTKGSTIDFNEVIESIEFWTGDLLNTDLSNNEAIQLITEVDKPDNLYRSIMEYPLLTCYDQHKDNLNDGTLFPVSDQTAIDAAHAVDAALLFVNKWIIGDLTHYSLAQVIILVNCIQMLDEMFQFGNDCFIGY